MLINNIQDKKIIFISFPFFDYEKIIKMELENLGANVDYFPGKFHPESFRDNHDLISAFVHFFQNPFYKENYTNDIIDFIQSKNKVYDILFVIQTFPAKKKLIQTLKKANPNFKSYIYFWDAFSLFNNSDKIKCFDYCFSLDRKDCKKYKRLIHLHGFYPQMLEVQENDDIIYDWSYIGSVYPMSYYRIDVINKLLEFSKLQNLSYYARLKYRQITIPSKGIIKLLKSIYKYIFIQQDIIYSKKIKENLSQGFLSKEDLPLKEVFKIQNRSQCIIDINYRNRTGITFQCFPVIAKNKKLITTNKYIVQERFYNPNNILIIDEKNPIIDLDFLKKPYEPVDISYLRLDNWLKIIFNTQ